jgi:single-stranded DNA-binding protein
MSFWLQEDQRAKVAKFQGDKPNLQDKGKYSTANLSTSRPAGKGKEGYIYSNWSFVRFVGKAHEYVQKHVKDGDLIVLNSAMVSKESYENKEGKTVYPPSEQVVVFDCSVYRKAGKGKNESDVEDEAETPEDDSDSIPF